MPHSNADEDRVFSMIRKNKTHFPPNHDPSKTLGSIIIKTELEQRDPSRKFVFLPQLLKAAKSATRKYNMMTISVVCISGKQFFL